MSGSLSATLQPLTPVWTGDSNGDGGCIRETGIAGSLRWWYETIIRGLGLYACDPTVQSCIYDSKKQLESICLACQLFGCTGYSRRFQLRVEGGGNAGSLQEVKRQNPGKNNHRGWRIPSKVAGPFTLHFLPMRPGSLGDFERAAIYYTLHVIETYGAIGAKTSHGQGVIRVTGWSHSPITEASDWIREAKNRRALRKKNPQPAPNLSDLIGGFITLDRSCTAAACWWSQIPLSGFGRFDVNVRSSWIPSAPAVRARLRSWLRSPANVSAPGALLSDGELRCERHRLMGTIRPDPKGSNLFVTHLYKTDAQWSMRIFAFVPQSGNTVDRALRALLMDPARLKPEVEAGLNLRPVTVTAFPTMVSGLLT